MPGWSAFDIRCYSTKYPGPWKDPKTRSTLGFCSLHHNWGIYFLDPPRGLGSVLQYDMLGNDTVKCGETMQSILGGSCLFAGRFKSSIRFDGWTGNIHLRGSVAANEPL